MTYFDCVRLKNNDIYDSNPGNNGGREFAYRVPEDAECAVLTFSCDEPATITFKSGDHVFGGKDAAVLCPVGFYILHLDLNTLIQHSGEHKGCVVIQSSNNLITSQMFILEK